MDATILKAFFLLSLCVGGMGLLFFFLKKYGTKLKENNSLVELKILGKASLQPKSHLFIVQAEGKKLLIGVTDNNINTLAELNENANDNKSIEEIKANSALKNNDLSFANFLKSVVKN